MGKKGKGSYDMNMSNGRGSYGGYNSHHHHHHHHHQQQNQEQLMLDPETVMQVVDPATKQKMGIKFNQTEPTNGRIAYIHNIGTKRDSYLCMLYQKGRCKSHGRCNQIHADKQLVQDLRAQFYDFHGASEAEEPLSHQRAVEVVIVDPVMTNSRIVIPLLKSEETVGRSKFFEAQEAHGQVTGDFYVCPAYLQGTPCASAETCTNIHPDITFLKYIQEPNKPCCPFHGTDHTVDYKGKIFMINKVNQRCPLPLDRVMTTRGLKGLMASPASLAFACNRVCRLHQEKRCQWGRECANLHICREFYAIYGGCVNPAVVSLPSRSGLQILPNGKYKPVDKPSPKTQPAESNSNSGPSSPAVGKPLQPTNASEKFGIPLVTEEGPVPRKLLPVQAQVRYPSPGAVGTPMEQNKAGSPPPQMHHHHHHHQHQHQQHHQHHQVHHHHHHHQHHHHHHHHHHHQHMHQVPHHHHHHHHQMVHHHQHHVPVQAKKVPETLQEVPDVDSEPATPPLSPAEAGGKQQQQVPQQIDPHTLHMTSSSTSSLHAHSSLTPLPPSAGYGLTPAMAAAGVPPPLGTTYLPQTWSEMEPKNGGNSMGNAPQYFSQQHISELMQSGNNPNNPNGTLPDPSELHGPLDSFSDIRQHSPSAMPYGMHSPYSVPPPGHDPHALQTHSSQQHIS